MIYSTGELDKNLMSEVDWQDSDRKDKFYLDNPNVWLIFNAGELTIVEYGNNDILVSVRWAMFFFILLLLYYCFIM